MSRLHVDSCFRFEQVESTWRKNKFLTSHCPQLEYNVSELVCVWWRPFATSQFCDCCLSFDSCLCFHNITFPRQLFFNSQSRIWRVVKETMLPCPIFAPLVVIFCKRKLQKMLLNVLWMTTINMHETAARLVKYLVWSICETHLFLFVMNKFMEIKVCENYRFITRKKTAEILATLHGTGLLHDLSSFLP